MSHSVQCSMIKSLYPHNKGIHPILAETFLSEAAHIWFYHLSQGIQSLSVDHMRLDLTYQLYMQIYS